ncbi:BON domain-containing protein [Methylobacter sp. YRD-M1]|uniref:BON domain-containing protein n=1 Tax=Methylobacter sp. YRD-M1 TaxID=2911520 RepID=UPI00227AB959|nr:BON domain-containing protein [Methylobacter sp. YRD-M1]WAK02727.1 BON domain-containing protein [Methylobacter sp. YRD-M1]
MKNHLLLSLLLVIGLSVNGCATTGKPINERRHGDIVLMDQSIEANASQALKADNEIEENCHVNVTAYNGMALVTGEAPSAGLRSKIIAIVRTIPNIKQIHNAVLLAEPSSEQARTNDALITANVKAALASINTIPGFNGSEVKVVTENGVVYLMGLVHKNEGAAATEAARRTAGVRKIVTKYEYID